MKIDWSSISEKVYSILKGSCESVSMYDAKGNTTIDPSKATRFFAVFKSYNKELDDFTVLVACHDEGHSSHIDLKTPDLKNSKDFTQIHQVRNHLKKAIGEREGIKINWFVFDHAINPKEEAVNNIKESKDVSKVYGTTKSSFQQIGEAKLIIRHSAAVNENVHGARSRKIRALFVENKIGERFAYPHLHVAGARAFARHISNGGTNHDAVSEKLYALSEDYIKLRRSANSLRLNESANPAWAERLKESMHEINRKLKSMHGPKGYKQVSEQLLVETSAEINEESLKSLQDQLAECCGCPADSAGYQDLGTAARYIAAKGPIEEPVVFTWKFRPDISKTENFSTVAERLNWQLNELAMACSNEVAQAKLHNIAEQIAGGVMPNESDLNVIRHAYESSQTFVSETSPLPEEEELKEYLDTFAEENIFGEEITDEGNEFSGALAAAKAKGEKTFKVDGKEYDVQECDLAEDGNNQNSAVVNKPGHPMHGKTISLMNKTKDGFVGSEFDQKTKKVTNSEFKNNELTNVKYTKAADGYKDEISEDDSYGCNMTAENEHCPIHGMDECMSATNNAGVEALEDKNIDEVSMSPDDPDDFGFDHEDDEQDGDYEDEDPDFGDYHDQDDLDDDRSHFADPSGRSALRAATPDNPRVHSCPTCGHPNRLTTADVARGYQCDDCADAAETGREIDYYVDPDFDDDLDGEAPPLGMDKDDLYESQVARLKDLAGLK